MTFLNLLVSIVVVVVEEVDLVAIVAHNAHLADDRSTRVATAIAESVVHLFEGRSDLDPPTLLGHTDQ